MAKANMIYEKTTIASDVNILKRYPFEARPVTLDTTAFTSGVCKAGTVVKADGTKVASPFTGAFGVLLHDVYIDNPQGAALVKAYIDGAKAKANSGVDIATISTVLPMIVIE